MTRRKRRHRRSTHALAKYDPKPRRLRIRRRRTHDPGFMRSMHRGPRGGTYFQGPHKRRYDPAPRRRFRGFGSRVRGYGSKLEQGLTKYGLVLGGGLSALYGIVTGIQESNTANPKSGMANYFNSIIGGDIKDNTGKVLGHRTPEIMKAFGQGDDFFNKGDPLSTSMAYLKYKFLGLDDNNNYVGSAWVLPFWAGIGSWIFSKLPLGSKLHRIQRPLGKIGLGLAAVGAIGALALPGSNETVPDYTNIPSAYYPPNPSTTPMLTGKAPQDGRYHNV